MSNFDQELEKIVLDLLESDQAPENYDEALEAIKSLVLEQIVGEDIPYPVGAEPWTVYPTIDTVNALRQKQREKLR